MDNRNQELLTEYISLVEEKKHRILEHLKTDFGTTDLTSEQRWTVMLELMSAIMVNIDMLAEKVLELAPPESLLKKRLNDLISSKLKKD